MTVGAIASQVKARSGLVIGLGILAIIFLGPLAGVPGWIMANQDLRDLQGGLLPADAQQPLTWGKWLSIAGTFLSPLWLWFAGMMAFVLFMVVTQMAIVH
jgi:hypothetical protein